MSGRVVDVRRGEELSLHLRISEAADPLHFGTLGGALAARHIVDISPDQDSS